MVRLVFGLLFASVSVAVLPTVSSAQLANDRPSLEELIDTLGEEGAVAFIELRYLQTLGNEARNLHWASLRTEMIPLASALRDDAERRQRILDRQPNQAARDRVARELDNDEYRPEYDPTSPEWTDRIRGDTDWEVRFGPIYSHIDVPSDLSIGTFAILGGDEFGSASGGSGMDRAGGSFGLTRRFVCEYLHGPEEGCDVESFTDFEWATGELSYSGTQTVGQDNVTFVGLTYNENVGASTGVGSGFAGDGIVSSGTFSGTWGKVESGLRFRFDPDGPPASEADAASTAFPWYPGAGEGFPDFGGAGRVRLSFAPSFEYLSTDGAGRATLTRAGVPLAFSQTHELSTDDKWYGGSFRLGYDIQVTPGLEVGVTGRADLTYHVGTGTFRQDTMVPGTTTTQGLSYRDEGVELGGGIEFAARYNFDSNTAIRFHGEVAVLPGATGFDARTSPNDMPGAFRKKDLTRATVGFDFLRSF
ncbi:MAG: hypothetical protein RIC18_02395 [Hoeflea sp.]|uniref:hypothetical protein n=1 Tax=Hoeflea sp. TaxID=1940281 RepID=UPI0032EF2C2C